MKYLIFDHNHCGHHLEYIHHLWMTICLQNSDNKYIFILSPKYKDRWPLMEWPNNSNITIQYISEREIKKFDNTNFFRRSIYLSKILSHYINKIKPQRVILNDLTPFMPSLPLYIHTPKLINGILYKIPRYKKYKSTKQIIIDKILLHIYSKSRCFNQVLLLNDENSPNWYNSQYNTSVFKYIPDPINIKKFKQPKNNVQNNKIVLIHGGGLGKRKGTFTILKALELLDDKTLQQLSIHLVGSISNKEERSYVLNFINSHSKIDIMFTDSFVSFETLLTEIANGDYMLIPYENTEQSSGFLGYAAYYRKPVIGPANGLLGDLIKSYDLGLTVNPMTPEQLKNIFQSLSKGMITNAKVLEYTNSRTITNFSLILLS